MLGFELSKKHYVVVLLVGLLTTWLILTMRPEPVAKPLPSSPIPIVDAIPLVESSNTLVVRTQGLVEPAVKIQLVAQVSGRIVWVDEQFNAGGRFSANEPLLQIEASDYEIALAKAKAQLADARQVLAKEQGASTQAKREWRDLGSQQANDLFLRKPQLASAQATVEAAEAGVRKAQLDLERTHISAPFAGVVLGKQVDIGQFVAAGTPVAEVFDISRAEVRLPLTQAQRYSLNADAENSVLLFTYVAGERFEWPATFLRVEASVDRDSRQLFAVVGLDNPFAAPHSASNSQDARNQLDVNGVNTRTLNLNNGVVAQAVSDQTGGAKKVSPPLSVGQFLQAEIRGREVANSFTIPRAALRQANQIWVVDGERKLRVIDVRVLQSDERRAIVLIDDAAFNQQYHRQPRQAQSDSVDREPPFYLVTSDLALAISGSTVRLAGER